MKYRITSKPRVGVTVERAKEGRFETKREALLHAAGLCLLYTYPYNPDFSPPMQKNHERLMKRIRQGDKK